MNNILCSRDLELIAMINIAYLNSDTWLCVCDVADLIKFMIQERNSQQSKNNLNRENHCTDPDDK